MEGLARLAYALALGLLVGVERGWSNKDRPEGQRTAGLRTFGVIGLFGALASYATPVVFAAALLSLAGLLAAGYAASSSQNRDVGLTTEFAALVTFGVGALAGEGRMLEPAVCAVLLFAVLSLKEPLHAWVEAIGRQELYATVKLLLLAVVMLPVLPAEPMGPWGAWKPFELGWMAVLIAAISYVGYFAVKLAGEKAGTGITSVLGGLASSTAVTLHLARRDAEAPSGARVHAAGIVLASATLLPRVFLEASVVHRPLGASLALPLGAMAVAGFAAGAWLLWGSKEGSTGAAQRLGNPLSLTAAAKFAALLAVIFLAAAGLREWLGETGVFVSAAVAGIADVDAITLAMARMAREGMEPSVAAGGVYTAVAVNTAVKAGLAAFLGTGAMSRRVAASLGLMLAAGAAAFLLA